MSSGSDLPTADAGGEALPVSDDPDTSRGSLATLVSASMGLDQLLAAVARFAAHAIPGADGAGITLLRIGEHIGEHIGDGIGDGIGEDVVLALAASSELVSVVDDLQYNATKEGPCITAAEERQTVRSGTLGNDSRWARFGPRRGRLGVESALSLPLTLPVEGVVGVINAYARGRDAFDERA